MYKVTMGNTWCWITLVLLDDFRVVHDRKKLHARKNSDRVELNTKMANKFFFPFCESYFEHLSKIEGSASSLKTVQT